MLTVEKPNSKAFQELVLYYLRERIEETNIDIKYCIVTNIYEWFIFDASYFEKLFFRNKTFVRQYEEWRDGKKVTKDTNLFYNDIAKPFIESIADQIECTYFDIRDYDKVLKNSNKEDDKNLIALQKILSPHHLLRVPFADDSNELDDNFYKELLHVIGLEEFKEGGKTTIQRKGETRSSASLIEKVIDELKTEGLHKVPDVKSFGEKAEDQYYNIALELCITWINRILFLKLLEGQLVNYHRGDRQFRFLNIETIHNFDELFKLFHKVLAVNIKDRNPNIQLKYGYIPYLNSSLFEISDLEDVTIKINSLDNSESLDFISTTILKEQKKKNVKLQTLDYLFKFLDAYDFASEGAEDIQENNKTLINASVLGKVFEKINGYKDGAIYTPGFITMYMCRQSIRLAVIQKFNDIYKWKIAHFHDIKNYISDRRSSNDILEFNKVLNSLHICDPAVGSGHFLVSSLNELIAIKSELGLLADNKGQRITDYEIEISNDELFVTDINGDIFEYRLNNGKPQSKEAQRLQKTLFHEKQIIIENCLFGVDVNPNSVKICRLRLWIELLKNAYYKEETNYSELETLPNIDINIKCGNSLLSRFSIDSDLSKALKSIKYDVEAYRGFVNDYKNEKSRDVKKGLQKIIDGIKSDFRIEIYNTDPKVISLNKKSGDLYTLINQTKLFDEDATQKAKRKEKQKKLEAEITQLAKEIEEIKTNAIYKNAFEWRFEFPEVLNNKGEFEGFDLIIGNPPYISALDMARNTLVKNYFKTRYPEATGSYDIYILFLKLGIEISKVNGIYTWIVPNKLHIADYAKKTTDMLTLNGLKQSIDVSVFPVFKGIGVYPVVVNGQKNTKAIFEKLSVKSEEDIINEDFEVVKEIFTAKTLKDFGIKIMSGTTGFEAQKIKQYITETKKGIKFTVSGNVDRYEYNNIMVRYMNTKYAKAFISKGEEIAKSKWNFWSNPKIVVAGMTKEIEAVFVEEPLAIGVGCYGIYDFAGFNPKALVGLLNSKYLSYYLNIKFKDKHLAGGYLAINKSTIEALPLVDVDSKTQQQIANLVDQITLQKQQGNDTSGEERKIDDLVYRLYNISPDEKKLIEGV